MIAQHVTPRRASTWMMARSAMGYSPAIRQRMADDLTTLSAEHDGVEPRHLIALGWTAAQVSAHGHAAAAEVAVPLAGAAIANASGAFA